MSIRRIAPALLLLVTMAVLTAGPAPKVTPPVESADVVWGALVHATRTEGEIQLPEVLASIAPTLRGEFGYTRFVVLGQQRAQLGQNDRPWLIPGGGFSLQLAPAPGDGSDGSRMTLQLFQGKKLLVKTMVELGCDTPLLIRGPLYGNGQLIIVLKRQ